jgi:hypothetical protein
MVIPSILKDINVMLTSNTLKLKSYETIVAWHKSLLEKLDASIKQLIDDLSNQIEKNFANKLTHNKIVKKLISLVSKALENAVTDLNISIKKESLNEINWLSGIYRSQPLSLSKRFVDSFIEEFQYTSDLDMKVIDPKWICNGGRVLAKFKGDSDFMALKRSNIDEINQKINNINQKINNGIKDFSLSSEAEWYNNEPRNFIRTAVIMLRVGYSEMLITPDNLKEFINNGANNKILLHVDLGQEFISKVMGFIPTLIAVVFDKNFVDILKEEFKDFL